MEVEPCMAATVLQLCDHAEGSYSRGSGAPVCIVGVLATFDKVLVPMVVGLLVQSPCTIHHYTGVEFPELEGFIHWGAVLHTLCCLAAEILLVVESDLPGLSIYLERVRKYMMKSLLYLVCESLHNILFFHSFWVHFYKWLSWLFS